MSNSAFPSRRIHAEGLLAEQAGIDANAGEDVWCWTNAESVRRPNQAGLLEDLMEPIWVLLDSWIFGRTQPFETSPRHVSLAKDDSR